MKTTGMPQRIVARLALRRRRRAGSLILDVVVALIVFVAALGAFLTLANDKTKLLESSRRQGLVLAAAEAELARLTTLSERELAAADEKTFAVPGFPGTERDAPRATTRVRPGTTEGTFRIEVRIEWPTERGHRRTTYLSSYRASAGLRSRTAQER